MRLHILRFCLFASLLVLSFSCNKNEDKTGDIVDWCWEYSQSHPFGFTVDISTKKIPTHGIVVGYEATQNSFGKEGLRMSVEHATTHANIVGGWLDKVHNLYYFDSDTIFDESNLIEALEWGRKNKQMSVYVLSTGEVVYCGGE